MSVNIELIKQLRGMTGAKMSDCKTALEEANENIDKAVELLRKRGIAAAAKKADRTAAEGMVHAYIHGGGRIGVLVEVNVETDFAAKNEQFKTLVNDIAMQIAATNPQYIDRNSVALEAIERERNILIEQAQSSGKPANIIEKMVEGRLNNFFKEICLLEQPFIKDPDKTVQQVISEAIHIIGENIVVRRFVRYERGEGIEKKQQDFAREVMQQVEEAESK